MNVPLLQQVCRQSLAAQITFPQVVGKLLAEGVESYHADLVRHEKRYYMPNGETHVEPTAFPHGTAAPRFCAETVQATVRTIQRGEIDYPEFIRRVLAAGCVYYVVYLTGKKVVYFGRDGATYTEPFPQAAR